MANYIFHIRVFKILLACLGIYKLKKIQVGLLVIQNLEPVPTASCILRPPRYRYLHD
jgi:hypothetical protein